MKKILLFSLILFCFLLPVNIKAKETVNLHFFYGDGCPHCAKQKEFLKEMEIKYPNLKIHFYETWENEENAALADKVKYVLNNVNPYVPYTVIGTLGLTGFNDNIEVQIEKAIINNSDNLSRDIVTDVIGGYSEQLGDEQIDKPAEDEKVKVPFLGSVDPKKVSLPLLAIAIGTIDGFNPCAMWVLILLISITISMKDKKKMIILGTTFIVSSALVYMLFMLSWLKVTMSIGNIIWIRNIIAILAVLAGTYNLFKFIKSLIKKDVGCEVTSNSAKKKTTLKVKQILEEKSFFIAMISVIILAFSVNIVELACSAGLPLIYTQILSLNNVANPTYFGYILLYILFFLIDDLLIFFVAVKTFKVTAISNKFTKYSSLVGGIIMVIIGILMLFVPKLLLFS